MPGELVLNEYPERQSASVAAAQLLAESLRKALHVAGDAGLVVSGGSTPQQCFRSLSGERLDWSHVTIVPSDERWVEPGDESSNERLIRSQLMQGPAAKARLLTFYREDLDAAQAPAIIGPELERLARPFACALLGMGEDGHFASLFPDFDGLDEALDTTSAAQCTMVRTVGSPYLRISLTLAPLLDSSAIVLLFFGDAKRRIFEAAAGGGTAFPVEALLSQDSVPVTIIWAP
jgi:6-phosphogluconolactonase